METSQQRETGAERREEAGAGGVARPIEGLGEHCALPPEPAGAGAKTLEEAIAGEPSRIRRCLMILGPGVISGASNNDPSAIATYARAGAMLGMSVLWIAPMLFPLLATIVYVCAKLAMVSGHGLAGVLKERYPRWILYPLVTGLVIANTLGAGADIGAVAEGINLIVPAPRWLSIPVVTLLVLGLQIFGSYRAITSIFKWLTLALFAFIGAGLLAKPSAGEVLWHTVVPGVQLNSTYLSTLVAIFGTALSPYLFFWQTGQRVEEELCAGRRRLWQRRGATEGELKYAFWDVNAGMFFGVVILYFIILSTAATIHKTGGGEIQSAADAAKALQPLAGRFASTLFAAGFIGAGLLAIPVLTTGVAYALAEMFGWPYGLGRRPRMAPQFYGTIAAATLVAMGLNFTGIPPMRALFLAALVNGILTPAVLAMIMLASSSRRIMGKERNGLGVRILGWATVGVTAAATLGLAISSLW